MKNKLFILLLIPMAFAMTSFDHLMQPKGKVQLAQAETDADAGDAAAAPGADASGAAADGASADADDAAAAEGASADGASASGAEAAPAAATDGPSAEPATAPTEAAEAEAPRDSAPRMSLGDQVRHLQDVVSEIRRPLKVNLDGKNGAETTLTQITFTQPSQEEGVDLSRNRSDRNSSAIILNITAQIPNDELEAAMQCETCEETTQRIQIEVTESDLNLPEGKSIEDMDEADIQDLLRRKHPEMVAKLKDARTATITAQRAEAEAEREEAERQAEAERAERDCGAKAHRERLSCYIARVKDREASQEEREQALATLENELERLFRSDRDSDERLFDRTLARLTGHEDLRALQEKFEGYKKVKAEADRFKDGQQRFQADISKFSGQHLLAQRQLNDLEMQLEMQGYLSPQEWQIYHQALANERNFQDMMFQAENGLMTARNTFHQNIGNMISSYRREGVFNNNDVSFIRGYAVGDQTGLQGRFAGRTLRARRLGLGTGIGLGVDSTISDTVRLRGSLSTGLGLPRSRNGFSALSRGLYPQGRRSLYMGQGPRVRHMGRRFSRGGSMVYNDQYPSWQRRTSIERGHRPIGTRNYRSGARLRRRL